MGRVPLREDDGSDALVAQLFARAQEAAGEVPNVYRALANAPRLLEGWIRFGWGLREGGTVDRGLSELVILRVAQLAGSEYVWRSHRPMAVRAGVGDDQLAALATWRSAGDVFSDVEHAALAVAEQLTSELTIDAGAWRALAALVPPADAVELVLSISWYGCVARVVAGLDIPLDARHLRVPGLGEG